MSNEIENSQIKKLSEVSFSTPAGGVNDAEVWLLVSENAMRQPLFRPSIFESVGSGNE